MLHLSTQNVQIKQFRLESIILVIKKRGLTSEIKKKKTKKQDGPGSG